MNLNLLRSRAFAFLIDALLFLSVMFVLIRIFNFFAPGSDVREDAMQLYTQKDFIVFTWTMITGAVLMVSYMTWSYTTRGGQTIGHKVARIRIQRRGGGKIGIGGVLRVIAVGILRFVLIVVPGPMIALAGGEVIASVFALIWGLVLIMPIPVQSKPRPVSLWEILGGYEFKSL